MNSKVFESDKQEKGLKEKGDQSLFFLGPLNHFFKIVELFMFTIHLKNYKVKRTFKLIFEKIRPIKIFSFQKETLEKPIQTLTEIQIQIQIQKSDSSKGAVTD